MVRRSSALVVFCWGCLALAGARADEESKGFLGVRMKTHEDLGVVIIIEVVAKSPAEKAGLKIGDVILRVACVEAKDHEVVRETIGRFRPGDRIGVEIGRQERDVMIHVVLAERPKDQ